MVEQLSIYAENKKGAMGDITGILAGADIDIESLVANDSAEFGIIRMLVSDTEKAAKVLKDAGYLVHIDKVLSVEMADRPGGLDAVLKDLRSGNINIDYIYISYDRSTSSPMAIIRTQDLSEVELCLQSYGHKMR